MRHNLFGERANGMMVPTQSIPTNTAKLNSGVIKLPKTAELAHQRHPAEGAYEIEVEESPEKTGLGDALHPE